MAKDGKGPSLRFVFANEGGLNAVKEKIETKFDDALRDITEEVESNFGSRFVSGNMFESGLVFKNKRDLMSSGKMPGNKRYYKKLADAYERAWTKRYGKFQEQHQKLSGGVKTPHQKYKEKNMGQPAYHNDREVKYSSHTLWTGLMFESILDAFKGGNEHLSVANLLLTGGFRLNKDKFPKHYFKYFTPWFRKKGIVQGDLVQNDPSEWDNIKEMMILFIKKGFKEPMVKVLNNLEIKV